MIIDDILDMSRALLRDSFLDTIKTLTPDFDGIHPSIDALSPGARMSGHVPINVGTVIPPLWYNRWAACP
ncbi:MAG: hypothetical protein IKH39_04895, partial [Candidatus Methanomethylophilaceae archaeon]|nr:hypothetical protein [Candidatus Methanomethylophilaceae archaeon]